MATIMATPRHRPSLWNLSHTPNHPTSTNPSPSITRRAAVTTDTDIEVGDAVNVPGGMDGVAKFVGEVRGKQGLFVGVELSRQWAVRGKNDGDADGLVKH